MTLTLESQRIARTRHQRVEVTAAAGSGKTTTLVARCKDLISNGVAPKRILFVSFSTKAVDHVRKRLSAIEGGDAIRVETCHALALDIINTNLALAGMKRVPTLLSDADVAKTIGVAVHETAKTLIREGRHEDGDAKERLAAEATWLLKQQGAAERQLLAQLFGYASATCQPLAPLLKDRQYSKLQGHLEAVKAVRKAYRKLKRAATRIDYGDFIALAVKVLESEGEPKGVAFEHLLVDEYQDTSPAQARLFVALTRRIPNILVVGDPRQAIFGFGGARYTPLASLLTDVKTLPLSRSHRLPQTHADLASAIAGNRRGGHVVGHAGGTKPVLMLADSEANQAWLVSSAILDLLKRGVSPSDIVVLARLKDLLKPVQRAMRSASVPSSVGKEPLGLQHVRAVLNLVTCVEYTAIENIDNNDFLNALDIEIPPGRRAHFLRTCRAASASHSLEGYFETCSRAYMQICGGIRNDLAMRTVLKEWATRCRGFDSATDLLNEIDAMSKHEAVETSTIHAAKGREWKHVFVLGVTDGVLPDRRADTPAKLAEERNLLYVAATRASEALTLVHSPCVVLTKKSPSKKVALSRFLKRPKSLGLI